MSASPPPGYDIRSGGEQDGVNAVGQGKRANRAAEPQLEVRVSNLAGNDTFENVELADPDRVFHSEKGLTTLERDQEDDGEDNNGNASNDICGKGHREASCY